MFGFKSAYDFQSQSQARTLEALRWLATIEISVFASKVHSLGPSWNVSSPMARSNGPIPSSMKSIPRPLIENCVIAFPRRMLKGYGTGAAASSFLRKPSFKYYVQHPNSGHRQISWRRIMEHFVSEWLTPSAKGAGMASHLLKSAHWFVQAHSAKAQCASLLPSVSHAMALAPNLPLHTDAQYRHLASAMPSWAPVN